MRTIKSRTELARALAVAPRPLGFVPTMGALHEGHAALVRRCRRECATVVVSVYVNPLQFGANEDIARYPRDLAADATMLDGLKCDVLFAPEESEMAPAATSDMDCGWIGTVYEGAVRPGHFNGVLAIVRELFSLVGPDHAYFGRKDAQQLAVIRGMVRALKMPVEIMACETVRDRDGLALSSRNAYLSREHRAAARGLSAGLFRARRAWAGGERDPERLETLARDPLLAYDYCACVEPLSFRPRGPLLIAAVRLGTTRLIDNLRLDVPESTEC